MFYSDSGLYSPHQRWLLNTLPGFPWGYLPQMPDFALRCRQSRQISSSFRMSLGAVRSSHSNRDTSRFVLSISFPPVSVSSAGEPPPAHRPLPGPPVPQSPPLKPLPSTSFPAHRNLRPAHRHRSSSQGSPVPQSPLLKPLPNASTPTHGNLRPAHSAAALRSAHLFRTARLFPHQTAAAVENHTPVSSIQWMGWLSQ